MSLRRAGLLALVIAVAAVGAYVGSRIAGPYGAVVGSVSGVVVSTLAAMGERRLDSAENRRRLIRQVFLPDAEADSGSSLSPATLLVAGREIVPFIGREQELTELLNWCFHGHGDPLRVLVGAAGTGKTRLARELAGRLTGWDCHWVRGGQEGDALKAARRRKSLVIIDYAETRPRTALAGLLRDLAWPPGGRGMPALAVAQGIRLTTDTFPQKPDKRQVRVLLIARTVGDWWADLNEKTETLREQMILEKAEHVHLDTLARTDNDFKTHYDAAIQAFSKELKVFAPATQSAAINENSPILVIHMAALIAVLGFEGLPPDRRSKLLSQLLFHEEKYWLWSAESRGFADLGRAVRRQSVTVLCLSGAVTEADVEELLKRVPKLADASAVRLSVADWLRGLYPGDGGVLGSLQPHLLAEYLVVSELADRTFSNTALSGLPENGARNAFTVLGHAAQHDDKADSLIREAVEADPARLILPAISAAVDTGVVLDSEFANVLDGMSLSLTQLIQLSATIPLESRSLTAAATVIRGRLAEAGIAELRRTKRSATGHPEIMPRQTLLTELLRVDEFSRKRGLALPDSFRSELIKALGRQRRALTSAGQISEARGISQKLKEIQALDSPPDQRPTL